MYLYLSMSLSLYLSLLLYLFWSGHVSSSPWSNVSKVTSPWDPSLKVLSKCICLCHCLFLCLCHCLFVGQAICPHHSDQMSQRSRVSDIVLFRCSLNVFVIMSVFVFVIIFFLVRSCPFITLIKCLKGHKSLGSLCSVVKTLIVSGNRASKGQTRSPIELFWTAKFFQDTMIQNPLWKTKRIITN